MPSEADYRGPPAPPRAGGQSCHGSLGSCGGIAEDGEIPGRECENVRWTVTADEAAFLPAGTVW